MQELDPAGVGARNLRECLLIQLRLTHGVDSLVYRLVEGHLEDLAANRIKRIAKELRADADEIREAACRLTALVPRPGAIFQADKPHYVIPDIIIEQREEGFDIRVRSISKSVRINGFYKGMSELAAAGDPERQFFEGEAFFRRMASEMPVPAREDAAARGGSRRGSAGGVFPDGKGQPGAPFAEGSRGADWHARIHRQPFGCREVRADAEGHIRVEIFFFASGVYASEGPAVSADHIKRKIKELIRLENAAKPLSDQQLAEALLAAGLSISRRTVAKYREEMGIAPSSRRAARS